MVRGGSRTCVILGAVVNNDHGGEVLAYPFYDAGYGLSLVVTRDHGGAFLLPIHFLLEDLA